ncbi:MAG: bacillithiol system redox-active protein YtxJ [Segetibacter sp.]
MKFLSLEREEQLEEISEAKKPQIIFKHNTTCPISKGVLRSLKEEADSLPADTPFYILDLLTYRNISDAIAQRFSVPHQSPQLLLIKGGKCTYNQSLYEITPEETARAIRENE